MAELNYDYIAKLVRKTQAGDSDAFAELYAATYKKQYYFTYQYVKDSYLAQDILQDVSILVLKNIRTLKNPRLFISWLNQINFRVCYNVCQQRLRHEQELELTENINPETLPEHNLDLISSNPEKEVVNHFQQTELMAQILSLTPNLSQTIIMRYYNDMTLDEIADAMNCSRSTVKRRLVQGKLELKTKLGSLKGGGFFEE